MSMELFLGPYVEFLTPAGYPQCPEDLRDQWDRLLEDTERLEWNFRRGSPPTVTVRGREMWSWCAIPMAGRDNPPRWPMLLNLEQIDDTPLFRFDVLRSAPEAEAGLLPLSRLMDGIPSVEKVSPEVERDWFASAYEEELRVLERIFDQEPLLHWGVLAWHRW
jgi:hypothetical protein